jgi:hypothetical protein
MNLIINDAWDEVLSFCINDNNICMLGTYACINLCDSAVLDEKVALENFTLIDHAGVFN